ncbi:hypothetical protein TRAPUB_11973 [Trametes pubescens]|uniref:F-box domain-containing protein n=1 Tax=Trametes pubescens TaxID=154538 RepID=A0A1M2VV69_TRAPU|nr:hypothetical protein TRAPUB_11973 [Trametes pubescens]
MSVPALESIYRARKDPKMLNCDHFCEEVGPDQACQRQPDPDGAPPANAIFTHDPRLSNKGPCQPNLSLNLQLAHHLPPQPELPHISTPPAPTGIVNVIYLLHATPRTTTLKMPVSSESTLSVPFHPPAPVPLTLSAARAERPRNVDRVFSFGPLELLALNRDVLKTISDFCPPGDALQLAMTCKDAYELAMPRVLADVSIGDPCFDDGPDRLYKFCRFMLANPPRRIRHLRALRLLEGAFARVHIVHGRERLDADFSSAEVLAELLRQADNLRVIHIRDAEPLFQFNPAVYEALAQLSSLKELSLYYIGNSTLKAISQLRSTPALIENGLWKDGPRPQGDITPFSNFVDSVKHLKLWECGCMLESIVDRHVWPNLHTLDIGGRIAKLSELAHAFPNLRRLTFYLEFSVKQETGPAACWPELDYLETSAPIPSFPSPARRLQLQYPIGATPGSHNSSDLKTLPLMEHANPVVLSITVSEAVPLTMLERMKGAMPSLRYLELVYTDACGRTGVRWPAFQEWVGRNLYILRTTAIVGLCIGYTGADDSASDPEMRAARYLSLARTLTRNIKSLQYVGVGLQDDTGGMYALDCTWYRVASRPADMDVVPVLETLPAVEGERVREALQLTPRPT